MTADAPIIGFDIDGVLADFPSAFMYLAADLFEDVRPLPTGALTEWDFPLPEHVLDTCWRYIDRHPVQWENVDPLVTPAEIGMMWDAYKDGVSLQYVTSRHSQAREATDRWLNQHNFPRSRNDLHMMPDKDGYVKKKGYAAFIDDSPRHIAAMRLIKVPVYVRDWAYNRDITWKDVPRVSSVGEYLYLVERDILPSCGTSSLRSNTSATSTAPSSAVSSGSGLVGSDAAAA